MQNPPVAAPADRDPREMWAESEIEWHGPEMLRDFKFWWLTACGTGAARFSSTTWRLGCCSLQQASPLVSPHVWIQSLPAISFVMMAILQPLVSGLVCFLMALPVVCFGGWLIGIRRVSVGAAAFAGGLTGLSGISSVSMIGFMTGYFGLIIMFASFGLAILVGQIGAGWAVAARHPAVRGPQGERPGETPFRRAAVVRADDIDGLGLHAADFV